MVDENKWQIRFDSFISVLNALPEWEINPVAINQTNWAKLSNKTLAFIRVIKKEFIKAGLVKEVKVENKRTNKLSKFVYITPAGMELRRSINKYLFDTNIFLFSVKDTFRKIEVRRNEIKV